MIIYVSKREVIGQQQHKTLTTRHSCGMQEVLHFTIPETFPVRYLLLCFCCLTGVAGFAYDTTYLKVHFLYGSRPYKAYKESESKWFGGKTALKIFYPKKLRKRLLRQAKVQGWLVLRQEGTDRRLWEKN